jgi:hypothetical protein
MTVQLNRDPGQDSGADIWLSQIDANLQLSQTGKYLRGEGFVDFYSIEVLQTLAELPQEFPNRVDRPKPHPLRIAASAGAGC